MEPFNALEKLLADRQMTKRVFIREATAFGVSLIAASTIWSKVSEAAPKSGGHLRAAVSGANTVDTLDPRSFADTFMISLSFSIRDNLTTVAPDNTLQAGLAESWESSADAMTWTFNLRKGVEFSNGKSLEADDVISSMNLHRGAQSQSGAKGLITDITDITADGKNRVVFKLKNGNADFPFILTDYHLNILPTKSGEADWQSGIGTGAYNLEKFQPGVSATLKLNPNRWQQDVGFVASAELLAVNDVDARVNALTSGAADVFNKPDLKTLSRLKDRFGVQVVDVPGRIWHCAVMFVDADPYSNYDLRMALKYAINREDYVKKILLGYGTVGNDQPIGPAYRFHADDIPQRNYDPDKAKFHLKKAGYTDAALDLYTAELFPGMVGATELYQQQASKAGININIVRRPADGWFSDVWLKKPFQMGWWGPESTEDLMLSIAFLSTAPWNDTHLKNDRLDKLIIGARAELDEKKRADMYREAQFIIYDVGGDVVPAYANLVQVASSKVGVPKYADGKWKIAGSWEMDGGHFIKRWWLV